MIRFACDSSALGNLIYTDFMLPYSDQLGPAELRQLTDRCPHSTIVPIDRGLGDRLGISAILDVERGAARPADAPVWFDSQQAAGLRFLTVYASLDKMPAVERAMGDRPFWRFYAYWQGGLHVPDHPFAMLQFASGAQLGADVDLSIVHDDAWHPRGRHVPPAVIQRAIHVAAAAARSRDLAHELVDALGGVL